MKPLVFTVLCSLFFLSIAAQDCNCCSPQQTAFDFWVGKWTVYDTTGQEVGKNSITKLESGCILNEHWRGSKGSTGRSYNYFNRKDSTWNQIWIDNQGNHLELKGTITSRDVMVLKSELKQSKKGKYYDQISWTKVSDKEVVQLWELYKEDHSKITEVFKGIYRRD